MQPRLRVPKDLSNYIEISLIDRRSRVEYMHAYYPLTLNSSLAEFRRQVKETDWYKENIRDPGYTLLLVHQDVTLTKKQEEQIPLGAYTPRCATMTNPMKYVYNFRDTLAYMIWGKIDVYFRVVQMTQGNLSQNSPKEVKESPPPSPRPVETPQNSPLVPRETTDQLLVNFEPSLYTQSLMDSLQQPAKSFLDQDSEIAYPIPSLPEGDDEAKRGYLVI